jgi:putative ABC transport system ATP-binding protein
MREAPGSGDLVLTCAHVTKVYGTPSNAQPGVKALDDVSLEVPRAKITAVVGPSGSGKSTLLRILGALDLPDAGCVHLGDVEINRLSVRRRRLLARSTISYMFQVPSHNLVSYLTVREHMTFAAQLRSAEHAEHADHAQQADQEDLAQLLEAVGLQDRGDHLPSELSGGEQQRLAVATSVVGPVAVVLVDEPTAELDRASSERVLSHISGLSHANRTSFVVASHDPAVREIADEIVELHHGRRVR